MTNSSIRLTFNPASVLGVPGIMDVYRAGGITIANAPGTGISDDKAIYSFMPEIVEFYTGEKPILQNVPTWRCSEAMPGLRARQPGGSGGRRSPRIGRLWYADRPDLVEKGNRRLCRQAARPAGNHIAQPTLALSTVPIPTKAGLPRATSICGRLCRLSPNVIDITPGGLTRVARKKGSLVVNPPQGGAPQIRGCWRMGAHRRGGGANAAPR
ncbi:circularly permuted type 2 ATP-grasp protein [Novosphingobium sp.]|uniref:circularly permuted type 2 ATP-grasp protein n=1 Tax=Novosphingobium sp. TaxID=1874826 RepID=UPI0025F534E0|nr:circularly permuted type 2 ATP-grasp protein [Novosphingobium sp.]